MAFGGIVAMNRPIDAPAAEAIVSTFIEAVIAPGVDEVAKPILGRKPNMRVVVADFEALQTDRPGHAGEELRSTLAGVLVRKSAAQARDRAELFLLLSDHIADAEQRRNFIRKSVAAFKDKR